MAIDFPEPRWAVPDVIPEGLTLLVGAPKLGKSWLALNIGCAIASGGVALGSIPVDAGDVLYLALEDNGRRLKRRLEMVLGTDPAPERLHLATTLEPIADGGADRIATWIDRNPDARLIIIDVLARVRSRMGRNDSIYDADYAAVAELKRIADNHGVAVVVVHHTRKSAADDYLDTVSGSQGLAGAADGIAILARSRGQASATLKLTGRDVEETELALDFDAPTGTWKVLDGPAIDHTLGATRAEIIATVRRLDTATPKQLEGELPTIAPNTIRQTLRRMIDDSQLDTDGDGHYFIPVSAVTAVTQSQQVE